jgi:hypothetical protein
MPDQNLPEPCSAYIIDNCFPNTVQIYMNYKNMLIQSVFSTLKIDWFLLQHLPCLTI